MMSPAENDIGPRALMLTCTGCPALIGMTCSAAGDRSIGDRFEVSPLPPAWCPAAEVSRAAGRRIRITNALIITVSIICGLLAILKSFS